MTKVFKPEPGTIYQLTGSIYGADVRAPAWFKGRLKIADLLLCTGISSQGVSYLLLEADKDGIRAVSIGEALLSITAKAMGTPTTWQPTHRQAKYLEAGDTLRGESGQPHPLVVELAQGVGASYVDIHLSPGYVTRGGGRDG